MDGVKVMIKLKDLLTEKKESVNETIELKKIDNPKYKARLHQVKVAFRLAKVKLTNIKPIKARKGVVPKGHYDKSGDRLAPAWAITATDGKNTKSGEVIFQDGNDPGFYIDKDYMGLNPNNKKKIPRNIQRWMIGKKAHLSKGVDESVNEGGMGILTSDQADVLQAIVMRNKNKNIKAILKIALKDSMFKNVDKKELLGYIDGARQFVKYMKSHPG